MTDTTTPPTGTDSAVGIRIATAVVGGTIALLALASAALSGIGLVAASSSSVDKPIAETVRALEIDLPEGDVRVISTPGAAAMVTLELRSGPFSIARQPEITEDGGTLRIAMPDRVGPCWGPWCQSSATVTVELGGMELDSVHVTGDLGTLLVQGVTAQRIDAVSSVGDVMVSGSPAESISARSNVGMVEVVATAATRSITATADVGDVTVRVPAGLDYKVETHSDLGDVSVEIATARTASRSIVATSDVGDVRVVPVR